MINDGSLTSAVRCSPVPPTAEVSFQPKPCDLKNEASEKLRSPSSVMCQASDTVHIRKHDRRTDSLLVSLEDVLRRQLVLGGVVDKVFECLLGSLLFLGGFDSGNTRGSVGEERRVLASSRNGTVRVSQAVVVDVVANQMSAWCQVNKVT